MPTYEYKCLNCDHSFEIFQSMNAEPVKVCPNCGGSVKRLIGTGAGTIFKGSGFYQTDYKKPRENPSTPKKKEETKKEKKGSDSKEGTNKDK
jgi:putative FmdB family regulatory protein